MHSSIRSQARTLFSLLIFSIAFAGYGCSGSGGSGNPVEDPLITDPIVEIPADEIPADEIPADEIPADEIPADEIPEELVTPLANGSFIKTVEVAGVDNSDDMLFSSGADQIHSMYLLLASDITASGELSALRFQLANNLSEEATCAGVTIRIGHTSVDNLDPTFDSNIVGKGSLVTVLDNATLTVLPGNAGDFFNVPLTEATYYNGVDNLIIDIIRSQYCSDTIPIRGRSAVGYTALVHVGNVALATGSGSENLLSTTLEFSGGEKRVLAEDRTGDNAISIAPASEGRSQFLILASDIDGVGPITGIQFPLVSALTEALSGTYSVTLTHVPPETIALTETFAENIGAASTLVASDVKVTVPTGASEFWLPLTEHFDYDGVDNLLIEVKASDVTGGVTLRYQNVSGSRVLANQADPKAETGSIYPRGLEPQLRFHGATIARVSTNGVSDAYLFTTSAAGVSSQLLYLSSELGTGGTITRLACRMETLTSTETEYTNVQVVMSHTDAMALVEDMATNLSDPLVVYEDSYTMSAGLVRGDWLEIPLSSGFAYDGVRNLVIQTRSDAGLVAHRCFMKSDPSQYASRFGVGLTRDTTNVAVYSAQRDLRLWLSK